MALEHDEWIERVFGIQMPTALADPYAASGLETAAAGGLGNGHAAGASAAHPAAHRSRGPARPVPRAGLGPAQASRAGDLVAKMPPADRAKVVDLLNKTGDGERPYLVKAIASGHPASEVIAFHPWIAGKPHAWIEDNLHLVGNTHGEGIKQQWANSCVPTVVEAMRGELDPIYALRMHDQSPALTQADDKDGTRLNPKLAAMQRRELLDVGSDADSRGTPKPHPGESDTDVMGHLYGATGLKFRHKSMGFEEIFATQAVKEMKTTPKLHQAFEEVRSSLKAGLPVPLAVAKVLSVGKLKVTVATHLMLCVGSDPGPPPRYSIHDPDTGNTVVVSEEDMWNGDFHIGHAGQIFLEGTYVPVAGK